MKRPWIAIFIAAEAVLIAVGIFLAVTYREKKPEPVGEKTRDVPASAQVSAGADAAGRDEAAGPVAEPPAVPGTLNGAIFIGDSRTVGLFDYTDISYDTDARVYARIGFSTSDIINSRRFLVSGSYVTALDAVRASGGFDKAYIMLGVNELGAGYVDTFMENYRFIVDSVLEVSPDAVIVVQSIIPVTAYRSAKGERINNERIAQYNGALKEYTVEKGYFYLDVASYMSDKYGALKPEYADNDGLHLNTRGSEAWYEFLRATAP